MTDLEATAVRRRLVDVVRGTPAEQLEILPYVDIQVSPTVRIVPKVWASEPLDDGGGPTVTDGAVPPWARRQSERSRVVGTR